MKRPDPTEPGLLVLVKATGRSDRDVEREVGLPQGFLSKARKGGQKDPRAHTSWVKLKRWLSNAGSKAKPSESPPVEAVQSAVPAPLSIARASELDGVAMDKAIDEANTYDKVDDLLKSITKAIRREHLTPLVGSRMIDALKEKRMVMEASDKQKATIAAGATVVIRVEHVNDWRREPDVVEVKEELRSEG